MFLHPLVAITILLTTILGSPIETPRPLAGSFNITDQPPVPFNTTTLDLGLVNPSETVAALFNLTGHTLPSLNATTPTPAPINSTILVNTTVPVIHTPLTNTTDPDFQTCWRYEYHSDGISPDSALTDDCWRIHHNIMQGGRWEVEGFGRGQFHQLVEYGTCAFGVKKDNGLGRDAYFYVGNLDIMHHIEESIVRFSDGGRVEAYGWMQCQAFYLPPVVKWSLYRNGE